MDIRTSKIDKHAVTLYVHKDLQTIMLCELEPQCGIPLNSEALCPVVTLASTLVYNALTSSLFHQGREVLQQ